MQKPDGSLTFVFPKVFELFKFITWVLSERSPLSVTSLRETDENEFILVFCKRSNSLYYQLRILLIGESDINFYGIFQKLLKQQSGKYVLLGSCGSARWDDVPFTAPGPSHSIPANPRPELTGRLFFVNQAFKGDRGYLDANSVFNIEEAKVRESVRTCKMLPTESSALASYKIFPRPACCTNFMNENIINSMFADHLFDMETYDFFDVCQSANLKQYAAFRFVTDYVRPLGVTGDEANAALEHVRKYIQAELDWWKDLPSKPTERMDPADKQRKDWCGEQYQYNQYLSQLGSMLHPNQIKTAKKFCRLKTTVDFSPLFEAIDFSATQVQPESLDGLSISRVYSHLQLVHMAKLKQVCGEAIPPEPPQQHLVSNIQKFQNAQHPLSPSPLRGTSPPKISTPATKISTPPVTPNVTRLQYP